MKFLLDIPFVLDLAKWVWGEKSLENKAMSPEICVTDFPLMSGDCWKQLVVKGLGVAIIMASFLNKLPVMLNILNSKSTAGLSRTSVYSDVIVYANGAFYGFLQGHPFTAYGENGALTAQTIMILLLIWKYSVVSMKEKVLIVAMLTLYVVGVTMFLSKELQYLLMASIWPIYIYARGSQILETMRVQHTGAQSVVTTSMNLAGSTVRIATTIQEVGWDFAVLTGYFLSLLLNFTLFLQYWFYKKNTDRFMEELKAKKES